MFPFTAPHNRPPLPLTLHCATMWLRGHNYVRWVSVVFVLLLLERKGGCQKVDLLPEHSVRVMMQSTAVIGPLTLPVKRKGGKQSTDLTVLSSVFFAKHESSGLSSPSHCIVLYAMTKINTELLRMLIVPRPQHHCHFLFRKPTCLHRVFSLTIALTL